MTEPVFRGVGVALITIFDEQLEVDVAATTAHAEQLVELGVAALVVAGTTGEAASLDGEERARLVRAARDALPADVPVVAGTGAADARQAARFTREAVDAGADAVLALSPLLAADTRRYYEAVARAARDVPVLAYHYPAVCPPGIAVEHLADLPVAGMKDSTGDPDRLLAELAVLGDRPVYPGSSALISTAGSLGCPGVILALANAEPERCVAAWGGDGSVQVALTRAHQAQRNFPHGIKGLTSVRFGTPTWARMG